MPDHGRDPDRARRHGAWLAAVLVCGIVLPQLLLIGPALVGRTILLDLPILAMPGSYLPGPAYRWPPPHDLALSDSVLQFEPFRVYAVGAVRSGRLPLWNPLNYCGSPFLAANQPALLSPFRLIDYVWPGPAAIAWTQLAKALVAGLGAFLYLRRAAGLGLLAALFGGWCYPLCGYLTLWWSHPHSAAASWLPFVMLGADACVRGRNRLAPLGLALACAATLVSGHAATGAQVLIAGGLQASFSLLRERAAGRRALTAAALRAAAGFLLGVALSAPQTLPTLDYLRSSRRIATRAAGYVATPPVGLRALPQVLLPYFEGATRTGAAYLGSGNRQESAATAYAGFLLVLVAGPLAALRWRRRGEPGGDTGDRTALALALTLAVLGLAQVLDLPLLASLLDAWPLRALRNNRLTLLSGFGLLTIGAVGLDALASRAPVSRRFVLLALIPPLLLGSLSLHRLLEPPAALAARLAGNPAAEAVRHWFVGASAWGALLGALAIGCWLLLFRGPARTFPSWLLGALCVAELLASAWGVYPSSDPALYYPRVPLLQSLAAARPGRICGVFCLPPDLNLMTGLADVRGYDGADPAPIVDLLSRLALPGGPPAPEYARTMMIVPRPRSPLADLLGLRYLVYRGTPPEEVRPFLVGDDYFVVENETALPRAFVPRRVALVPDRRERLARLTEQSFDPRALAFVETAVGLPEQDARGSARLVRDEGERLEVALEMETDGLLVLSDLFDPGWKAFLDGGEREVLRVDHAFRGVVVPRGRSSLVFRYEPLSFRLGLLVLLAALVASALLAAFGKPALRS